jgi:hypothetical protein
MNDEVTEDLLTEVETWAESRRQYPGWIVPPARGIEHLHGHSNNWIQPLLDALPSLAVEQRLRILDEFNWRLETSLQPLWTNIAEPVKQLLDELNPYPEAIVLPRATLQLTKENVDKLPWVQMRGQWLRLATAVLRYHREERLFGEFDTWADRLQPVVMRFPAHRPRLCYERCLCCFARMDAAGVRTVLAEWPTEEQDPIWTVRRVAVLAELGDVREARQLAEGALNRTRQRPGAPDDVPSLAREGSALLLMQGLDSDRFFSGGRRLPNNRGRWEHLSRFYCDPRREIERLQQELKQGLCSRPGGVSRQASFQPGTVTRTYRLGPERGPDLLPAYQYLRLIEEVPYPPFCGRVSQSGETLEAVGLWCADHDPVRTHTLLCRAQSEKLIDKYLSRHRVASLPTAVVKELVDASRRTIDEEEPRASAPLPTAEDSASYLPARRLAVALELLGRLAIRFSPEEAAGLLSRALELHRSPALRANLNLPKLVSNLIRSLLFWALRVF